MEKYTIQTAIPTGKSSPMYGTEFHVKFAENEGTFKLWYKTPPTEGQVQEGTIDGWKFKKAKKEWNGNEGGGSATPDAEPVQSKPAYQKPAYKDNSDGMRQGMCFNNAANYVNALTLELTEEDWAKTVYGYANALYLLGDLGKEKPVQEVPLTEAPKSVQEVFGVNK